MMDSLQVFITALIQGVTEFLPISSSAHILLPSLLLDWHEQGLAFDVAVHLGSLVAVVWYLRSEIGQLWQGSWRWILGQGWNPHAYLACLLILATIPTVLAGLLFKGYIEIYARALWVIAATTIGFGILLGIADSLAKQRHTMQNLSWSHALIIGLAQVLALVPGTSRSGITMTAALMLGYERETAAKFSFLMAIPVIVAASVLVSLDLFHAPQPTNWAMMSLAFMASAVSAWLCLVLFMKLIKRLGLWPFVVYRLILGGVLLWILAA